MCPSHRCKPGSRLLGVRQEDGRVAILPEPFPVDNDFIEKVKNHPLLAEQRFRFTNKCIESGCGQWNDKGCGVVERMVKYLDQIPVDDILPACSIRPSCRWFSQRGADACRICPYVLTEITEEQLKEAAL